MAEVKQVQVDLLEKLFDAKLETMRASLSGIQKDIYTINKAINGNGQPGLMQRVEDDERRISNLTARFGVITAIFLILAGLLQALIPNALTSIGILHR